MRKVFYVLWLACAFAVTATYAQITTGSISGTVTDSTGAVVAGATVTVKGENGQNYTATTNGEGVYTIPGVLAGTPTYTVTISAPNFKTSVVQNVKVDVATPATVNTVLQAGQISEQVVITSGAEVLQAETASVGTTIQGRQILETPISTRNALDLITLLPGTTTTGVARTSSVNGLPKSALSVQVDGVDVGDQFLKSSDGFVAYIQPKLDAIDEVTVSNSNPGAESTGDGAIGIKFQTRRGTDSYRGSGFWQHRDEGMNTANFQNNYQNLPKQKLRLNQFGFNVSGPIPFLGFGEGVDAFDSGKGKRYFFVNYERFHINETSATRTPQVLTTEAQNGVFRYGATGSSTVNLFNLAQAAGLPNTIDPTVNNVLNTIRAATANGGALQPFAGGVFYRQAFAFNNPGRQRRRFLTVRTDFNIGNDHALEVIWNDIPYRNPSDFLNNADPAFPGLANFGSQNSDRRSLSVGFRSSLGQTVVNQFRYTQLEGWLGGGLNFNLEGGTDFFNNLMNGYTFTLGAGLTGPTSRNQYSYRSSPSQTISDNVTWVRGNHTVTFGGDLKKAETISDSVTRVVPTITFGVATQDTALTNAISATTMPGATSTEITNAQALYAALTGRVTGYTSQAVLDAAGQYQLNGSRHFELEQNTNGLYVQDSWKIRPNFSITGGIRWQPVIGTKMNSANYSVLSNFNMLYDVSGVGNLFKPGTLTGTVPTVRGNLIGEKAYPNDFNNFAPSVGFVWSPDLSGDGLVSHLLGKRGASVIRGGFSRAFIREGTLTIENSLGVNPGGAFANNRTAALGNLTVGTLFRTPGNVNLTAPAFNASPVYPRTLTAADGAFAFSPDFHTGYVDSWSIGYQRELDKNTVIEVRYVGNRGKEMQNQYNLNETNAIENGFGAEFNLAQKNLLANIAAGRGTNFRYFGAGTGTSPLPIMLSYFAAGNLDANSAANYSSANFANTTFVNLLSPANPQVQTFAATIENNFRATGTANGRPANFFNNCPTTLGACFVFDNSEKSWYDAAVVEVRRRLSAGVRFQASYTYGKSYTNAFAAPVGGFSNTVGTTDQSNATAKTIRNPGLDKSFSQIDVRHAFKFDATWDLPFGTGRRFLSAANGLSNRVFGGWTIAPVVRWQSGAPILMENIQLVGMTAKELQKAVGVYYNQKLAGQTALANVTYLPADIIDNTIRAFTTTGVGITAANQTGYAAGAAPTGRFIAPAGYGNCQYRTLAEGCGFRKFVLYGPSFFKIDATVTKRIAIGEKSNVELRASFFDVLNHTNWRLGGWTGNVNNITVFTGTFGQMAAGWSFQDPNGSNDPGGRIMDLMLRINW